MFELTAPTVGDDVVNRWWFWFFCCCVLLSDGGVHRWDVGIEFHHVQFTGLCGWRLVGLVGLVRGCGGVEVGASAGVVRGGEAVLAFSYRWCVCVCVCVHVHRCIHVCVCVCAYGCGIHVFLHVMHIYVHNDVCMLRYVCIMYA